MKLYLSSYRIPTPADLAEMLGKSLDTVSVALIPNAKDYYANRAWDYKQQEMVDYLQGMGLTVHVVDLRQYAGKPDVLKAALAGHDLIWGRGGNTYMLREAMRNSSFDTVLPELLEMGVVYGGDSAGALVAGISITGVELADEPGFASEVVTEGLNLVPYVILPHVDNPEFAAVLPVFRETHKDKQIIELKDSQAVLFEDGSMRIVTGQSIPEEKLSQEELASRLQKAAEQVAVGGRYEHYKHLTYKVLNVALREEDNEPCVVYQAEYGEQVIFIRPVVSWLEDVEVDGKHVKRFTKLDS